MARPAIDARLAREAQGFTSVVARRRNGLVTYNPTTDQFAIDASVGARGWHMVDGTEIDSDFVPAGPVNAPWLWRSNVTPFEILALPGTDVFNSGQLVRYRHLSSGTTLTLQPMPLEWAAVGASSTVAPLADLTNATAVVAGDSIRWANAYGTGRHFEISSQPTRLAKQLTFDNAAALGTPPAFMFAPPFDTATKYLRLTLIFVKSAGTFYVDGVPWNEGANNPVDTVNDVELRLPGGESAFWLLRPRLVESNPTLPSPAVFLRLRRSGNSRFLEVYIPWNWLSHPDTTYPLRVDPSIDDQIDNTVGDAWERNDDTNFTSGSSQLWVTQSNTAQKSSGFYYDAITIPAGATITAATITVYVFDASFDDMHSRVYMNNVDSALHFGAAEDPDVANRVLTTNSVAWDVDSIPIGWTTSPDFSVALQEVIDRPGWSSGNHICVLLWGNPTTPTKNLSCLSYDYGAGAAATIHLEYTVPGSTSIPVIINHLRTQGAI